MESEKSTENKLDMHIGVLNTPKIKGPSQMTNSEIRTFFDNLLYPIVEGFINTFEKIDYEVVQSGNSDAFPSAEFVALGKSLKTVLDEITGKSEIEKERVFESAKIQIASSVREAYLKILKELELKVNSLEEKCLRIGKVLDSQKLFFSPTLIHFAKDLLILEEPNIEPIEFLSVFLLRADVKSKMIESWRNYMGFSKREKILEYIWNRFENEDFIGATLAGLTQFEGIARERVNLSTQYARSGKVLSLLKKDISVFEDNFIIRLIGPQRMINFIQNELFEQTDKVHNLDMSLNRHAILHGDETDYYKRKDVAVKIILLLDNIILLDTFFLKKKPQ